MKQVDTLEESVPISDIFIDEAYGRDLHDRAIDRMAQAFDRRKLGVVYLSLRDDGRYACLDGWHRVTLCRKVEGAKAKIPARVYIDLSLAEEAELFDGFNRHRSRPMPTETFKARLVAKDSTALIINTMILSLGLKLALDRGNRKDEIRAVAVLEKVYDDIGAKGLREVVSVIRDAFGPEGRHFSLNTMQGLAAFWRRYEATYDRARVVRTLTTEGYDAMLAKAMQLKGITAGTNLPIAWGMMLRELYNRKLRDNCLEPWATYVLSTKGHASLAAKMKKLNASKSAEKLSTASRKGWTTRRTAER